MAGYARQPYYNAQATYPNNAGGYTQVYPAQTYPNSPGGHGHDIGDFYDAYSQGPDDDSKSFQSSHSRIPLTPMYDVPPVPNLGYQQVGTAYPPYPMYQAQGEAYYNAGYPESAYSQARQKMLKRRSVKHVELQQGNLYVLHPLASVQPAYGSSPAALAFWIAPYPRAFFSMQRIIQSKFYS
jgi:chitin synthase